MGEPQIRTGALRHAESPLPAPRSGPLIGLRSIARWLLVLVLAAAVWFFHGFLVPVLAASIIAIASWPLHRRIQGAFGLAPGLSGALLLVVILVFLIVPLALAASYAIAELRVLVGWAINANQFGAPPPAWISGVPGAGEWLATRWNDHVGRPGAIGELVVLTSGETIGSVYRGLLTVGGVAFDLLLALLFMLITLFVLYRDGDRIVAQADRVGERVLPGQWERISRVVPRTISATVVGMTVIAIGEGIILGAAYWIAGAPSPVTLGIATAFLALVPGGAPLAMSLVSAYLFLSGSPVAGAGLFLWGSFELFVVDKTIRPTLVGGPIKLPFLATFFGLVGGVKTMGLVGLFVGPVLMALVVAIWREWMHALNVEVEDPSAPL